MRTRQLLIEAEQVLALAGVPSPARDSAALLAHVLQVSPATLPMVAEVGPGDRRLFEALVERRRQREPLQHIVGDVGFRHVTLAVGPGVFVPRPETEVLAGWAVAQLAGIPSSTVVDLCTGSGAVAKAIADESPTARVFAVELSVSAHAWAERNLAGTGVGLRLGDMRDAFPELDGQVDLVTCNPPYIPVDAWESVAPEARDHDPPESLFSGSDGLAAIRVAEQSAARLLRAGGWVAVEHADAQETSAPAVFAGAGRWDRVRDHRDLAGRPRFVTARLAR